ncbi:MAG: hypothetical protein Q4A94_07760 [Plesiomonas sp.]|nr:hypothetical protein [Plesiomonas sp.]
MANHLDHTDAFCRVKEVQAILNIWLESVTNEDGIVPDLVCSLLTLLNGVPEAMMRAENELAKLDALTTNAGGVRRG